MNDGSTTESTNLRIATIPQITLFEGYFSFLNFDWLNVPLAISADNFKYLHKGTD